MAYSGKVHHRLVVREADFLTLSDDENDDQQEENEHFLPNLPHCRVPLQGLPCEADRKRVLGCLAVSLGAIVCKYPDREQHSREFLSKAAQLLFLDESHATALEPILYINPSNQQTKVHPRMLFCTDRCTLDCLQNINLEMNPRYLINDNYQSNNLLNTLFAAPKLTHQHTHQHTIINNQTETGLELVEGIMVNSPILQPRQLFKQPIQTNDFNSYATLLGFSDSNKNDDSDSLFQDCSPPMQQQTIHLECLPSFHDYNQREDPFEYLHSPPVLEFNVNSNPRTPVTSTSTCVRDAAMDTFRALLDPFVSALSEPSAGFDCVSILLLHYLLQQQHESSYDARHLHILKTLAVTLLAHPYADELPYRLALHIQNATRQFQDLERNVARILLFVQQKRKQSSMAVTLEDKTLLWRTLKITSASLAAGTVFAVTGGLAGPGAVAAAGIATTWAHSAAAAATVLGVGGGGLVGYKVQRRTMGLTHFEFHQHASNTPELTTVICISGWLRDTRDFYRPWGAPLPVVKRTDHEDRLKHFYSKYKPQHVPRAAKILQHWKGEEQELGLLLHSRYGVNPFVDQEDEDGTIHAVELTLRSEIKPDHSPHVLEILLEELGYPTEGVPNLIASSTLPEINTRKYPLSPLPNTAQNMEESKSTPLCVSPMRLLSKDPSKGLLSTKRNQQSERKKRMQTYHEIYTGELYTVTWESELLMELCDSVADMAIGMIGDQCVNLLKQTALHSLLNAISIPYALVSATNMIDGVWTIAIERADEAGKELAKSLLQNQAGHGPVTLMGYSMGARMIYACLKELARHQQIWLESNAMYSREPASIVQDVYLMGCPQHISFESWQMCRGIVSARLVNCYSKNDLILGLMFQLKRMTGIRFRPVCGTGPVNVAGVENVDVSHLISQHADYCTHKLQEILEFVNYGQPCRDNLLI